MLKKLWAVFKDEEAQSMVEYGIIIALISVVAIGVISAIGQKLNTAYTKVDTELGKTLGGGAPPPPPPPPPPPKP